MFARAKHFVQGTQERPGSADSSNAAAGLYKLKQAQMRL